MAKAKKTPRPKAQTPKGFRDYFGAEVTRRNAMLATIAEVYHRYGFDALETSGVETVEALGKFLPDVDRPNEGVFAWQEESDWLALRYDLTAPLARVAAQYRQDLPSPYRRYAMGPVWRNEKPGLGRFRQFYQCDADTVGAPSVAADAEICAMLADVLEAVGLGGQYIIRVNNRKVLEGILELSGLPKDSNDREIEVKRGIVLRAIDKLDRLGVGGVEALLTGGRKDESGDYTLGAGLVPAAMNKLMTFVLANNEIDERLTQIYSKLANSLPMGIEGIKAIKSSRAEYDPVGRDGALDRDAIRNGVILDYLLEIVSPSEIGIEGVNELKEMSQTLSFQGYFADRIKIDPSVVRGLGYYTGPVYEAELTFETLDEKGQPRQFGSVAGGGRYDNLVKRFTGQEVPATGVSIGVDRLLAALAERNKDTADARGPVVITVMDRDRMADYQAMAGELRRAGIRAEVYLGNPKNFGNQLKYADKRASPIAVIQGEDERARDVVTIKDLDLGARLAETVSHAEWKDQPAQFECARADMVAEIQKRLVRAP